MERLNAFELEVLENLPVEPIGLSLAELADGLVGSRGPAAKSKVKTALDSILRAIGSLNVAQGNDRFGSCGVQLYGVRKQKMPDVREFFAGPNSRHGSATCRTC